MLYPFTEANIFRQTTINKVRLKVEDSCTYTAFAIVTYYQNKSNQEEFLLGCSFKVNNCMSLSQSAEYGHSPFLDTVI